jgi:choline dehydrogenase
MSTAVAYLAHARQRPNLSVQANAQVRRILFNGRRALGVEARVAGSSVVVHGGEVILSGGAFGSPQLLLASGVGPAEELRSLGIRVVHDLQGVGRNLRCNPSVNVPATVEAAEILPDAERPQAFLICSMPSSTERNDMSLMPRQVGQRLLVQCQLRSPDSAGEVRLVSADPDEPPLIRYGYLHERDLRRLREAVAMVIDLGGRPALGRWGLGARNRSELATDEWILATLHTPFHASGTCKLGPSTDATAVVDDESRVHGLLGLRVADISITPRTVRAGPAATAVMIGEHVAKLLDERASAGDSTGAPG